MGSKNLIAKTLIDALPAATTFVDLFAGGCAMTHAAMLSNKYQAFIANDLSDTPQLFLDSVAGKFSDEKRWISREDFQALKDADLYVRYVWSFGNNGKNYMYSREVEPWKKALHYAWCMAQPFDVYVSEYSMPYGFHEVLAIPHRSRLSGTANNAVVERLYCNHQRQRFGQLDFLGQLFAEAV